MKKIYVKEFHKFKDIYQKTFFRTFILSILVALACFLISLFLKDFFINQTEEIAKNVANKFEKMSGKQLNELSNIHTFWLIFINNFKVCILICVLWLIPLYRLPAVYSIFQFSVVGIVLGGVHAMGYNVINVFIFGILPHGIFELTGIVYSASIGNFINKNILAKIFYRKKRNSVPFKELLKQSLFSYTLVVVPLLLLAAFIEAFITSILLGKFI